MARKIKTLANGERIGFNCTRLSKFINKYIGYLGDDECMQEFIEICF